MATLNADMNFYAKDGFKPDKESTWKYPATSDGWYRIHDTIRAEIAKIGGCMEKCAAGGALSAWQVKALKDIWATHENLVHVHHGHEDDLFTPLLKQRCQNLPEKLEKDHESLLADIKEVSAVFAALAEGDDIAKKMGTKFMRYEQSMLPHLEEEEKIMVPIMRAFFTQQEIGKQVAAIMQKLKPIETGAFVHSNGSKKDNNIFMAQEGIPFFVWYIDFKGKRNVYRAQFETSVQALLTGVAPVKPLTSKAELKDAINFDNFAWKKTVVA